MKIRVLAVLWGRAGAFLSGNARSTDRLLAAGAVANTCLYATGILMHARYSLICQLFFFTRLRMPTSFNGAN